MQAEQYDEALSVFSSVIEQRPDFAEGWNRLGDKEKARRYFDRLIADAPNSGQTPKAREWIATGTIPKSSGASCVGCHK